MTGKRCRLRWHDHLQPGLRHDPFEEVEKAILCHAYRRAGTQWSIIAKLLPGRSDNAVKNTFHSVNNKGMVEYYIDLYNKMGAPQMPPLEGAPTTALAAAQMAAAQFESVTINIPPPPAMTRRASKRTLESVSSQDTTVHEPVKRARPSPPTRQSPPAEPAPQRTSLRIALRRQRSEERSDAEGSPGASSFSTMFNGTPFTCQETGVSNAPCSTYTCMGSELAFDLPEVPRNASQESIVRWMSTWGGAFFCFDCISRPPHTVLNVACLQA